jgi:hypothetical protein
MSARNMNSTAMCLLGISLNDKVSQMDLYNGRTTDIPSEDEGIVWKNLFKLLHSMKLKNMNEIMGEFVRRTHTNAKNNTDEWFAELFLYADVLKKTKYGQPLVTLR